MAVAGLQNVPVLDDASSLWGDQDNPSIRASCVLQMWREIESKNVVSHPPACFGDRLWQSSSERSSADSVSTYLSQGPGSENADSEVEKEHRPCSQDQIGPQNDSEDGNSCISEQSTDLGDVERDRVRQIFHEWVSNGGRSHAANVAHGNNHSRAQWLGENECERVRIIREWVQRTSQQRGACGQLREEQGAEIGAQIEQIRDGVAVSHCEVGSRRAIRRLCGRQTLQDLLMKADRERKLELQALLENRPVSDFAHRNRIQSLLKVRFLRNDRSSQDQRPTSMAASELGLLRERHTVSGLREGFLYRLDNGIHGLMKSSHSDGFSNNEIYAAHMDGQSEANDFGEPLDEFIPADGEAEISLFHSENIGGEIGRDVNLQEPTGQVKETHGEVSGNEEKDDTTSIELTGRRNSIADDQVGCETSEGTSGIQGDGQDRIQASYELFQEHPGLRGEGNSIHFVPDLDGVERETIQEIDWQDNSVQAEELHESSLEIEGTDWQHLDSVEFSQWIDSAAEDEDGDWQEGTAGNWYHETSANDDGERSQLQESHEEWQEGGLQEALDNWLDGLSGQDIAPPRRFDAFLFSDDNNGQSTELRELSSRRHVSNLLQSGFRESLDQLIQSYVERQAHASLDWEQDRTSPSPALLEQDLEQSGNQNVGQSGAAGRTPIVLPSPVVTSSEEIWDQEFLNSNWPCQSLHQHLGMQEWEIINDLRIDMARLQQRMNIMQRMLEACMDMQLELQRSVRQEVSAALNRSADSTDAVEDTLLKDESKWDHVRKGICCICCNANIDSLLYRCGHMCTCSKCADKLVQGQGKCPMCQAPVIEVIRVYSIQ